MNDLDKYDADKLKFWSAFHRRRVHALNVLYNDGNADPARQYIAECLTLGMSRCAAAMRARMTRMPGGKDDRRQIHRSHVSG